MASLPTDGDAFSTRMSYERVKRQIEEAINGQERAYEKMKKWSELADNFVSVTRYNEVVNDLKEEQEAHAQTKANLEDQLCMVLAENEVLKQQIAREKELFMKTFSAISQKKHSNYTAKRNQQEDIDFKFDMDVDEVRKEVAEHDDFYRCQLKELQAKIQLEKQLERERNVEVPAFPQVSTDQEQAESLRIEKFLQSHPNLKTNSLPGKRFGSKELTSSALLGLSRLAGFPDMKQFSTRISELGLEAPLYRESILKPSNPKRGNVVPAERQYSAKPAGRGGAISGTKSLGQCSATRDVPSVQASKPSTKQKASAKAGVSKQRLS